MTDDSMQPNPGLNSSRALGFVNQGHITDKVIYMTTSEQVKDKSVCFGGPDRSLSEQRLY